MKKVLVGIFAFAAVALLAISSVSAFGGFGFGGNQMTEDDKVLMEEHREATRDAVESGDYDAWVDLMQERVDRMQTEITEENFEAMTERHVEMAEFRAQVQAARESGDEEAVKQLIEENGLNGFGKMRHLGRMENRNFEGCRFAE